MSIERTIDRKPVRATASDEADLERFGYAQKQGDTLAAPATAMEAAAPAE